MTVRTLPTILAGTLIFTSACSNPPNNTTENQSSKLLNNYIWSLQTLQSNQHTTTQLNSGLAANRVKITFNNNKLLYQGGCNRSFSSIQITPSGKMKVGRMVSTRMACPDRRLMKTDHEINSYLSKITTYQHTGNTLKLISDQQQLTFSGKLKSPPPSVKSTQKFIEIKSTSASIVWREAKYNSKWIQTNKQSSWRKTGYRGIDGFTPMAQHHYIVRIKEFRDPTTQQIKWTKDMIVRSGILR